ncbi:TonB-dependent receptor plug domain-containing protein [Parasphingorhabdus cellanae]|uniref:TonB-dependent receptor plug domain-containing protein n=1 Tax=Parasphingorhabdus cellanae TaxID=2806553 RepID=A0ABX7T1N8_9SPHN|nr:TonB-dependent receptor plug domain-containing protein [Parasphingorhabdus cellanae]QTD55471.1 TonB-dependent receptor plug domain-containing protein [Parasphingorhabdus cellanae]
MIKANWLRVSAAISALTASIAISSPTSAQTETTAPTATSNNLQPRIENGRQVYDASQFSRFNPRTALDIVSQVPGFIIDTGDDEARGLGQADENVLINGARIAGKNNDAFTVLGRISAANVMRVEIVDGATLSISGLSGQVLNLVTNSDETTGITGNFKWRPQWRRAGDNWFAGEASISGRLFNGDFTIAVENDAFRNGAQGPERITNGSGGLLFLRDEVARTRGDRPSINVSYNRTSTAGSVFNISGEYGLNHFRQRVDTLRTQPDTPDIIELFTGREREWNAEFSADYEFNLGGGRLKLIGLQRLEHSPTEDFFSRTFTDGITPTLISAFDRTVDEGESVLRAEYGWKTSSGTDWGFSLEGAYNFLESEAQLSNGDLDNSNTKVEEKRAELITTYGRPLSDNLTLQATLGGEYSEISQGDLSRSFVRPKGSVALAWRPVDDFDLSVKLSREVDQLDFFDFIASVEVSNDVIDAGNPDLVPPQKWRAEMEATKKLGAFGSATVTLFGEKISDIVDTVPRGPAAEARGNIDSADRFGIELVSTLLFDPIGWQGAKLDIEVEAAKSSVRDPITFRNRRIGQDDIYSYEITLRHDIPNSDWAWGAGIEDFDDVGNIRLDQIADFDTRAPYSWVFIEHKDVFGLTVNANLGNLFDRGERFVRTAYGLLDEDTGEFTRLRRDGPIGFIENRNRKFGLIYRLTISGSF